jgi:hypothetical protein
MMADLFYIKKSPKYGKGAVGLFAKEFIPKGTIMDFRCKNCKTYSKKEFAKLSEKERKFIMEHEVEENGMYSILCDKRMLYDNHSCKANCLSAHLFKKHNRGGVGLVVRDIKKGEEATSDYRDNIGEVVHFPGGCKCGSKDCMGMSMCRKPSKKLQKFWKDEIDSALKRAPYVKQPLKKELLKEHPELSYLFDKNQR